MKVWVADLFRSAEGNGQSDKHEPDERCNPQPRSFSYSRPENQSLAGTGHSRRALRVRVRFVCDGRLSLCSFHKVDISVLLTLSERRDAV